MPRTYRLKEPNPSHGFPPPFGLGGSGVPAFECLRLLSGSVDLELKSTGHNTKLRYCHLSQKWRRITSNTIINIIDICFDGDLNLEDASSFFKKSGLDNKDFWEQLKSELCFCLSSRKSGRNVQAFLHLYRIMELISVALPLVYASKLSDYREAVRFIKALSKNERDQDLAVLKYFSEAIAKDGTFASLTIDFPFSSMENNIAIEMASQLEKYVFCDKKISVSPFASPGEGVKIFFQSVPSFVVSCRNRLFHNAISNENFKLDPLHGADPVCSILIEPSLYWFGIIFTEILKAQASRYV